MNIKGIRISFFGLLCILMFFATSLLGRFLFPFGDEPDFTVRAPQVLIGDHFFWSPYYVFSYLSDSFDMVSQCEIVATPFSFGAKIDLSSCFKSFEQVLIRWGATVSIIFPIIIVVVSRLSYDKDLKESSMILKQSALGLSILFPSMVFYLGVFAEEQFTLVLSLLIFYFWDNKLIVLLLISLITLVDLGNSVVVITFVLSAWFYLWLSRLYGVKKMVYLMLAQVFIFYIMGFKVLELTAGIPVIADKSNAMFELLSGGSFTEKYPVILRPVITFMTFVFFSPAFVKVPLIYFVFSLTLAYASKKLRSYSLKQVEYHTGFNDSLILSCVAITSILSYVFMFPNYSNAKYYVFLLPFFIHTYLYVFSRNKLFLYFIAMNLVLHVHLILFRI